MIDHTDLTEQIRRWDEGQLPIRMETLFEAARIYANPNHQAAEVMMVECGLIPVTNFDVENIVAAALTPQEDTK